MPFDLAAAPASPTGPLALLTVTGSFPVLSETFVSNEIRAMRALGHRVTPAALSAAPRPCQPEDEAFRAETRHLADAPAAVALLRAGWRPDRLARALQFAHRQGGIPARSLLLAGARLALLARRAGARHIHAHFAHAPAATAIVAARLGGMTVSFTGHGFEVYGAARSDLRAKLQAADLAVAVCADMAAGFRAEAPDVHVVHLPCGVDPSRFRPAAAGEACNGRLLAVGRLAPQKGYGVLLAALAALPPAQRPRVDIVGAGLLAETIAAEVATRGLGAHVALLGARPADWIAAHGPAYAGFLAPYVIAPDGDRDTGPLSVKEAMAMGLPVVASALMGLKETVEPGCGRLVPPGDAAALAAAIHWLAMLPAPQRRALGAAGRRRVEAHFTLRHQAEGLAAAIAGIRR